MPYNLLVFFEMNKKNNYLSISVVTLTYISGRTIDKCLKNIVVKDAPKN